MVRKTLILLLAVLLGSCGREARAPVVVYSPHGRELLADAAQAYEAAHPGQVVQWLDMGSQDALDRIRTERQNPQADVWWGAPMTMFEQAEGEQLLERYVPTWDSAVASDEKSPRGYWYGTFRTPEVIMYNNRLIAEKDAPKDWDDLLDPRWKNQIIIRYPLASGTMRIIFGAMIQREERRSGSVEAGFAWLRKLDANTRTYTADPTQLYMKIARGEGTVTVWDLPDVELQAAVNKYPFGFVVPASGTPVITDAIAIVRGAKHEAAARQFYEFVTSRESLVRQAAKFFRIPVRRDIPPDSLPGWMTALKLTPMQLNWQDLSAHEREWMKAWDERVKGTGTSAQP